MARLGAVLSLFLVALPAAAQNEDALRKGLEGKSVTLKIDLPASHKGVDLRFDRADPLNTQEHFARIKEFDVAVREGQKSAISHVKVKGDMIELQLAGGGFNWTTDTTTKSLAAAPKTSRETELDKLIKAETDRAKKRDLEDERSDLQRDRERRDERHKREIEDFNREARERDRERALRSGSRFNLRFKGHVPPDALSPDGLLRYLEPWAVPAEGPSEHAK
jgi:hypothetical protein